MDVSHIAFWRKDKVKTDSNVTNPVNNCNCSCESFEKVLSDKQSEVMPKYALPEDMIKEPPMLKYAVPPYYQDYDIDKIPPLKYAVPYFPQTNNKGIYVKPETNVNENKYGIPKFMNNSPEPQIIDEKEHGIPNEPDKFMLKYAVPKIIMPDYTESLKPIEPPAPMYAIPDSNDK